MEVAGFVIGVLGPVQQVVEILQLIIDREKARRNHPKGVSDLRKLYEDFMEKLQPLMREYDGKLCDLPQLNLKVFEGCWEEMQQCFDRAGQVLTELHERLQKRSVVGNFFRPILTAQKIESLKKDLQRADQRLAGVNAILATAAITEKNADRVMRHTSKKLEGLNIELEEFKPGFAGASGQQRDSFRACFIVPLNPPHVTLNFATAGEGTPLTREAAVKISILKHKSDLPMLTVLKGAGGLGKTCTLRGLARQDDVKKRFEDGVYYLSLGEDASEQTVIKEVCKAIRLSGGRETAAALEKSNDLGAVVEKAKEWFQRKKFLLLTDDVWDRNKVGRRVVLLLFELVSAGDDSGLVFTTRDRRLAEIGRGHTVVEFEAFEPLGAEARATLFSYAGFQESDVQDRASEEAIGALLKICGGFPIALAVAGKGVSALASEFEQAQRANAWAEYISKGKTCWEKIVDEWDPEGYNEEYLKDLGGISADVTKERNEDVEKKLRAAKVKQSQCFLLTLGGGGRGKTSTVRSIRGMKFTPMHVPTELASLSRMLVVPGGRQMTDEELEDIALNSESLVANLSRVAEFPEPEESPRAESVATTAGQELLREQQQKGNRNVDVAGESVIEVDDLDRSPGLVGNLDSFEFAASKRDFSSVLDRASTALKEDPFPVGVDGALVQCWDLGGQGQYMMAHALFVGFGNMFLFVIDLSKLCNPETKREEVIELSRWMQLVYVSLENPASARPIIVGTRKASCDDIEAAWEVLRCGLRKELSDAVYDTWVKNQSRTEQDLGWRVPFVAIENSQAIDDPVRSGLVELEIVVNQAANSVVDARLDVPARWVALVEELEKIECKFLRKSEVCDIVDGFPAFDADKKSREEDAMKALRYYRGLGRLVLFELSEDDYVLFPDPSVILGFVRKVTGPEELARQRLGRRNAETLDKGILTLEGLATLWEEYPGRAIPVMLDLLCRFDILMRLQGDTGCSGKSEDLIAIPALLPSGMEGFKWKVKSGDLELHFASHFDEGLPPGLAGSLIAHLHRTIGGEHTRVGFLRSNAAILSARLETGRARVFVAFFGERRRLCWTVRGQDATGVARSCMESLEEFLDRRLHVMQIPRRHVIMCDCKANPHGCGGTASVEFEVSRSWVLGQMHSELANVRGYCLSCEEPWRPCELTSEQSLCLPEDTVERPVMLPEAAVPYDVFISHAGSDKQSAAYPLYRFLEAGGIRCFLDEEGIEVSRKTTDAQLYAAMRGSKAAVFILSADFIGRKWPMRELQEFLNLVDRAEVEEREGPLLLPLFYKLRVDECKNESLPHMEGYEAQFRANGFFDEERQDECSTEEAMEAVRRLTRFPGLRNDEEESEKEFAGRVGCRLFKFFSQ